MRYDEYDFWRNSSEGESTGPSQSTTRSMGDYSRRVFDRSRMSGAGFARHFGIKYSIFASWILKRRKSSSQEDHKN